MADEKISAMPAATATATGDLIPIVQGGVNKKATKAVLFQGAAGATDAYVSGALGFVGVIDHLGTSGIQVDDANKKLRGFGAILDFQFGTPTGSFQISAAGNISLDAGAHAGIIDLGTVGTAELKLDQGAGTVLLTCANLCSVKYAPAVPGNWAVPVTTIHQALDRLVAAVVARTLGGAV